MNTVKLLYKDMWSRKSLASFEKKKTNALFLKSVLKEPYLVDMEPVYIGLHKYYHRGLATGAAAGYAKVRSICKLTGRPRAVVKGFNIARTPFKMSAQSGSLAGVTRSSW